MQCPDLCVFCLSWSFKPLFPSHWPFIDPYDMNTNKNKSLNHCKNISSLIMSFTCHQSSDAGRLCGVINKSRCQYCSIYSTSLQNAAEESRKNVISRMCLPGRECKYSYFLHRIKSVLFISFRPVSWCSLCFSRLCLCVCVCEMLRPAGWQHSVGLHLSFRLIKS